MDDLVARLAEARTTPGDETWPYLSRVGAERRYLGVFVPKAACTTLKAAVLALEGDAVPRTVAGIHGSGLHRTLGTVADDDLAVIIRSDDWFRFTFVRNPYGRLLSAWKSKLWRPSGEQFGWLAARVEAETGRRAIAERFDAEDFRAFVRFLVADDDPRLRRDAHFAPQVAIARPDLFAYDFVGRFERFGRDFRAAFGRIGAPRRVRRQHRTVHNARPGVTAAEAYDDETASIAHHHYQDDFREFGYAFDSWRLSP